MLRESAPRPYRTSRLWTGFDKQVLLANTYSWDVLADAVSGESELADEIRAQCLAGISTLRNHLGDDWPLSDSATGHPLLEYFTNHAPFTRVHIGQLGHAMELLAKLDRWPALLARLRQGREAPGALLEVELAYPPLARGWEVELSPATQPGRYADLRISAGRGRWRRSIWIEASIVDDFSLGAKGDMTFQQKLVPFFELLIAGLEVGGRLHIDPTLDEEEQLLAMSGPFWEACLRYQKPDELIIPGVLELWAVPVGDREAKRAMIARGHSDGFVGGVMDNPLKRLLRVVRAKLGQLPVGEPGLIILEPPPMLFRSFPLDVIVNLVQQQLFQVPSAVGVGLIQWVIRQGRRVARVRSHESGMMLMTVPDRLIYLKQMGLVFNPSHTREDAMRFALRLL